jgi:hypothetical protein
MTYKRHLLVGIVAAGIATVMTAPLAMAGTSSFGVTAGTQGLVGSPNISTFSSLTLNGRKQITAAVIDPFITYDARGIADGGTSGGWNVTVSLSSVSGAAGGSIPATGMSIPAPTVQRVSDNTDALTAIPTGGTTSLTATAISNAASGKIVSAPNELVTSNDTFVVTPGLLTLAVPVGTQADTYTATWTITAATGP